MVKKLALITPWPPQQTGIADYAYDLASAMRGPSLEIHVLTNERAPCDLEGVIIHHVDEIFSGILDLAIFDGILVQLGNHPHFHDYMPEIIRRYKCVVELHDVLLHHLLMGRSGIANGGDHYFGWLSRAYGVEVATQFRDFFTNGGDFYECTLAHRYPCSDVVASTASNVIVHSVSARDTLVGRGFLQPIHVVNLCQRTPSNKHTKSENGIFRIGVFGGVQINRQVNIVLCVLAKLDSNFGNWQLDIVGEIDEDCLYLKNLVGELGIDSKVNFLGRLQLDVLNDVMSSCDAVVSLRNPTMGETSAIVIRALQMNVPCIVSDVGWYKELPACVVKVDNNNMAESLEQALQNLKSNPIYYQSIIEKIAYFATTQLDLRIAADDILLHTFGT